MFPIMAITDRATLMGIPQELRNEIFSFLFHADIGYEMVSDWRTLKFRRDREPNKFRTIIFPVRRQPATMHIPWLALMQTNRALFQQVQTFRQSRTYKQDDANQTWTMELQSSELGLGISGTTWRSIPCPPSEARRLRIHFKYISFREASDGGPTSQVSQLVQVLNHVIHCGPFMNSARLLSDPMHLLSVDLLAIFKHEQMHDQLGPRWDFQRMTRWLSPLARTGALGKFVKTFHIAGRGVNPKDIDVRPRDIPEVPPIFEEHNLYFGMSRYEDAVASNAIKAELLRQLMACQPESNSSVGTRADESLSNRTISLRNVQ